MPDALRCSSCGAELDTGSPAGLCARCLLRLGLSSGGADEEEPTLPGGLAQPADSLGSIGPYRLQALIGEGGMGTVYVADQTDPIRRRVALKVIKRGMDTREVIARFESERQALALMSHPGIARVLDAGTTDEGLPYFVMELVAGLPITEYCDRHRLDSRSRLQLVHEVCQAIQHAHQKGIIHRDIKPSNVLVVEEDGRPRPKVIDFGVARAVDQRLTEKTLFTQRGIVVGTPGYMSPEQADPTTADIDTRTDIYSLGVLLYELVVGVPPFDPKRLRSAGWAEMQRIIREEEPPKPSARASKLGDTAASLAESRRTNPANLVRELSGDIDWIVLKALEKDRARRYPSATEMAADLSRYLANEPVEASPPSAIYRLRKLFRRHRLAFGSAMAVAAALVIGLLGTTFQYRRAELARRENRAQLVRMNVADGMRLAHEGNVFGALPWLARALRLEENVSRESHHRLRIGTLLDQAPRLVRLWTDGHSCGAFFSRDGRRVAAGGEKGIVSVWSVETGGRIVPPLASGRLVTWLDFSPDGDRLASGDSDGSARIWDLARPDGPRVLSHAGALSMVRFSPDGRKLVTASEDGTARVWDAASGAPLCSILHGGEVRSAVFSADGSSVLSAGMRGGVRLSDAGTCRLRIPELPQPLAYFAFYSADGLRIVSGGGDFTARVWEAASGRAVTAPLRHGNPVMWAAFSRDRKKLVTAAEDSTARVWDPASGVALTPPLVHGDSVTWLSLSPDGRLLATVSDAVRLWDTATGKPLPPWIWGATRLWNAEFSPDGRFLLTGGDTVRVWDLAGGEQPGPRMSHTQQVIGLSLLGKAKQVLTHVGVIRQREGYARIWNADDGEPLTPPLRHSWMATQAAASPNEARIATVSCDGTARLWDASTGEPASAPVETQTQKDPGCVYGQVAFGGEGDGLLATWTPRALSIFSGEDLRPLFPRQTLGLPLHCKTGLTIDRSGERLAAVSWNPPANPEAAMFDLRTGKRIAPRLAFEGRLMAVRFAPGGGSILATGEGFARLLDSNTGRDVVASMPHSGRVENGWFDAAGRRLVTVTYDGEARLWESGTGRPLGPALPYGGSISRVDFSPDGRFVATVGQAFARLWDPETGLAVADDLRHPDTVWDVRFLSNAKAVTACQDGIVRVWDLKVSTEAVKDLEDLATVLSSQRIEAGGAIVRVPPGEVAELFARLERDRPEFFRTAEPKAAAWHGRIARELSAAGRFEDSLPHFDEAIRLGPERATLYAERASARAGTGDFHGAISDFSRAVALRPDDAELLQDLVLARLAVGDTYSARAGCVEMLERYGQSRNPDRARHTATACAAAGGLAPEASARVVALARIALEIEPENPERLDLLELALARSLDNGTDGAAARNAAVLEGSASKSNWRTRAMRAAVPRGAGPPP